nr:hypothetical protein [Tanacetum cinerariifolium]
MFIDEQPPDYSFPPRFDVYPDDFLEIKSDATFDDDSFDSEREKIKEADLLIDPLNLPCDILSECDSFNSQDFSRDDVLPSPNNEDKVFNPGILSHEKSVLIITRVTQENKLAVSFASWLFEDSDPPKYELLVFKEVLNSMILLLFSAENEEKVFKLGIYTFKKFHCCFLSKLSHPGFPVFKVNMIFLSLMKIFHVQNGKNTPLLDKKTVVVTSDPLALIAEKTKVSKRKEKVVVSSNSKGSDADDFSELKKITAWLAKAFNRTKFYSKPTNNNLRTSFASSLATRNKSHFAKDCKKSKVKDYEYYKTKMLLAKKDKDYKVLLAEEHAWMKSSSDSDQEINANMVFMAQI